MIESNNDEVICPNCVTQFRAIPVNVQTEIADLKETIAQPDLVAEIKALKAENVDISVVSQLHYDQNLSLRQQLSAAQASEGELLKALLAIAEADNASTWTAVCMRHAAKDALDINKARKEGK